MNKSLFLIAGACLFVSLKAFAKPATTLKITDPVKLETKEHSWFARADAGNDLGFKGAAGFGAFGGYKFGNIFVDAGFNIFAVKYGALKIDQRDIFQETVIDTNTEVFRPRTASDTGSIFTIGPGIGHMTYFFGSKKWVQIARTAVHYASFKDATHSLTFTGFIAYFQAALGYELGPVILAPSISWNLGFVRREPKDDPIGGGKEEPRVTRLPIQWWSAQISAYLFVF